MGTQCCDRDHVSVRGLGQVSDCQSVGVAPSLHGALLRCHGSQQEPPARPAPAPAAFTAFSLRDQRLLAADRGPGLHCTVANNAHSLSQIAHSVVVSSYQEGDSDDDDGSDMMSDDGDR